MEAHIRFTFFISWSIFLPWWIAILFENIWKYEILARNGNPLRTGAVGPFLVLCLVLVLRYVYTWFVDTALEGCAAFHVDYMLFVTNLSGNGLWISRFILSAWHLICWRPLLLLILIWCLSWTLFDIRYYNFGKKTFTCCLFTTRKQKTD